MSAAQNGNGSSRDAKRIAAVILEVLAGARTTKQAAEALGYSVNHFYKLESDALAGLVRACEPRPKGKRVTPEGRIAKLEHALAQAERERARYQALHRVTQQSVGVKKAPPPSAGPGKRKPKKPVVRALRAAKRLQSADTKTT